MAKKYRAPTRIQCLRCMKWHKVGLDFGKCCHSKLAYAYRTCPFFVGVCQRPANDEPPPPLPAHYLGPDGGVRSWPS